MKQKMNILAGLFSFFIAFFLFLLTFAGVSRLTLMSENYLYNQLEETEYYANVCEELTKDFKKSAGAAGFDPAIYDGFLKEDEVRKDAKAYIATYFKTGQAKIDNNEFKTKLSSYLHTVIKEEGLTYDDSMQEQLNRYIEVNANGYRQQVQFPFIQYIVLGIDMINRVLPFVMGACVLLIVIAMILLYRMKLKKEEKLYFTSMALAGGGWLMTVLPAILLIGGFHHHIKLEPEYFYLFFTGYLDHYLWILLLCGIGLLLIAVIIFIVQIKQQKNIKELPIT